MPDERASTGAFMEDLVRDASRLVSPSAERNLPALQEALAGLLPASGRVLEIGSGTGQHVAAFAAAFPQLTWQPSEPDAACRDSIAAWRAHTAAPNLLAPLALDVAAPHWEGRAGGPWDVLLAVNVLHIAPWATTEGLLRGAAALLTEAGAVLVYGPFRRAGDWVSQGNERFDRALRGEHPAWGVRDTVDVDAAAETHGLTLTQTMPMPANNTLVVLQRRQAAAR